MVWLSLIALVLAWPTGGLSLLVLFLFACFKGYLKGKIAKSRDAYRAAEFEASECIRIGHVMHPGWISEPAWSAELVKQTMDAAIAAGMSKDMAASWFSQQDVADGVMTMAACLEKQKFKRAEQIALTYEFVEKLAKLQVAAMREAQPA